MELNIILVVFLHLFLAVSQVHCWPRLCGKTLADTMRAVCGARGYYHGSTVRKRSISSLTDQTPFRAEAEAKSFLGLSREKRRTGRIAHECCDNLCSWAIIESYCNPWPEAGSHPGRADEVFGLIREDKSADMDRDVKFHKFSGSEAAGDDGDSMVDGQLEETGNNRNDASTNGAEENDNAPETSNDSRQPGSMKTSSESTTTTTTRPSSTTSRSNNDENTSRRVGGKSNRRRNKGSREGRRSSRRRNKRKRPKRADSSEENYAEDLHQSAQDNTNDMNHLAKLLTTIDERQESNPAPSSVHEKTTIFDRIPQPFEDPDVSPSDRFLLLQRSSLMMKGLRMPSLRIPRVASPESPALEVSGRELSKVDDNEFPSLPDRTLKEQTMRTLSLLLDRNDEALQLPLRGLSVAGSNDEEESNLSVFFSESETVSQVPR